MMNNRTEWILERVASIVDRWDKEEYTADSLPMRGLSPFSVESCMVFDCVLCVKNPVFSMVFK